MSKETCTRTLSYAVTLKGKEKKVLGRPLRAHGVGGRAGIHHLISAVNRQCIHSLPSCLVAATEIACRCSSYSAESFRNHNTKSNIPSCVADITPTAARTWPSTPTPPSSTPVAGQEGVIAEWVPDALGYHLPLGLRERSEPAGRTSSTEEGDLANSDSAETHGAEKEKFQDVSSATREVCASNRDGGGGGDHHGGHPDGPPFCGPLPNFATSPVFEWKQCLWQWRPVKITSAGGASHHKNLTGTVSMPSNGGAPPSQGKTHCIEGGEHDTAKGRLGQCSKAYYLVPFLLCPTVEVHAIQPLMHDSLRKELAAVQSACHHRRRRWSECAKKDRLSTRSYPTYSELETQSWLITMPTPVGELSLSSPRYADGDVIEHNAKLELPTFAMIEGEPPTRVGGRIRAWCDHGATRPTLPQAETWEVPMEAAQNEQSASAGNVTVPYVHVFCSERSTAYGDCLLSQTGKNTLDSTTPSSGDASHPTLPFTRRNVVGGGLAELLLAVDRYAALIARGDLALSAACWATLCDTKNWWVVQRLRVCPLEMERELVAATEAHKLWQQYAVSRNNTLVGKSSHSIYFYDYPFLAKWPLR
ncbi:hypothetical protein, conserved [Leishmania tarentolae]|uniref:Uncharacterized protein n=1 Tax=Leishmania tarentolae TaxID=5689 RepID=A0A640KQJ4_LEITA|nr:hypothetical protein, conserved [Leishmania tarentolae]